MASQPQKSTPKPPEPPPARPESPSPVYKIASTPEPSEIDSIGWSSAQGVTAAYRFVDAVRRDAARD